MTIDIITAIEDPNLFRTYVTGEPEGDRSSWTQWLSMLRVLYGIDTTPDEGDVIRDNTGRNPREMPREGFSEALLLCGRRSGKSKTVALIAAYEAVLSGRTDRMSAGEIPMVAVLSPTRFQSRIIHSYLKGVFESSPILRKELAEESKEKFVLRNGVEVAILTGDPRVARGFSLIACVVDEIAFFGLSEESKVKTDSELIRALRPSLATTGGPLIAVGSPYASKGYAFQTWKRCWANDKTDVLVWNAPSLEMNPSLNPAIVDRAVEEDPLAASVEYCVKRGLFREDVDNFITRAEVEQLVIPGRIELAPVKGRSYRAFADVSGGRGDDAALAIGHKEGRKVVLDLIARYPSPHIPTEVILRMSETLRKYDLDRCGGDAYAAEWVRSAFRDVGIDYQRVSRSEWKQGQSVATKIAKPKSQLYLELLPRLHSGEVELLDDETLIYQLSSLQRRTRSGARDAIDHPPNGKDDLANALAGVVDAVMEQPIVAGGFEDDTKSKSKFELALQEFQERREAYRKEQEWLRTPGPPEPFDGASEITVFDHGTKELRTLHRRL